MRAKIVIVPLGEADLATINRLAGTLGGVFSRGVDILKGMRMPGRMGGARISAQNLRVELVDPERNLLAVRGSVPGARGGLVMIKQARKSKELARIQSLSMALRDLWTRFGSF